MADPKTASARDADDAAKRLEKASEPAAKTGEASAKSGATAEEPAAKAPASAAKAIEPKSDNAAPYPTQADLDAMKEGRFHGDNRQVKADSDAAKYKTR